MTADEILSEARADVVASDSPSSLRLVGIESAHRVLTVCERRAIGVLGVEAFRLEGQAVVPQIDAILDLSGCSVEQSLAHARRYLDDLADSGWVFDFEFVD